MKSLITKIIVTSSILATSVPSCALAATAVNFKNDEDPRIPVEFLDISTDGTLYGFSEGITIDDIKRGGYSILSIPSHVKKIANLAFALNFTTDETPVQTLQFEAGSELEEIGAGAFKRCHSFLDVVGLENCNKLKRIGSEAFASSGIENKTQDAGRLILPSNLEVIESQAFSRINIRKIQIPASVKEVGARAFYAIPSLMDIDFTQYNNIPNWMYKPGQTIFWSDSLARTENGIVTINLNDNTMEDWEEVIWNRLEIDKDWFSIEYGGAYPVDPVDPVTCCLEVNVDQTTNTATVNRFSPKGQQHYSLLKIPNEWKPNPDKPQTYKITKIAANAFASLKAPARLVLPENLVEIGESAFENTAIKGELVIPETVTTIGKSAFKGCDRLTGKIVIPDGISNESGIGDSAFEGCTNITSLVFNFDNINSNARQVKLGKKAFSDCTKLSLIDLTSWTSEGSGADTTLSWDIPKTDPEKKEQNPFKNISKTGHILTTYGGSGVVGYDTRYEMFINNFLFNDYGLKQEYRKRKTEKEELNDLAPWLFGVYWKEGSAERSEFEDTDFSIKNLSHLTGLKPKIKSRVAENDTINIPGVTTDIDDSAFRNTFIAAKKDFIDDKSTKSKYWYFKLNNSLINIGNYAFADNTGLAGELTLPLSLKTIGDYAFSQCYQLRGSFDLSPQLEYIGDAAFINCIGLSTSDLIFPTNLTHVGANAFYGISTPEVTINKDVDELSDCAFMGIENLETIDLTNFEDIPTKPNWSSLAFFMKKPAKPGTVLVNAQKATVVEWTEFLVAHGLSKDDWVVQEQQ